MYTGEYLTDHYENIIIKIIQFCQHRALSVLERARLCCKHTHTSHHVTHPLQQPGRLTEKPSYLSNGQNKVV